MGINSELAKLRGKISFLLFGIFYLRRLAISLRRIIWLSFVGVARLYWLPLAVGFTPSVRWLPTTRHNVVSLDISGGAFYFVFIRLKQQEVPLCKA